jgi:DNA-binding NarL/FixJ family response regulator
VPDPVSLPHTGTPATVIRVIAVSFEFDGDLLVDVLRAGARGALLKDHMAENLKRAIRLVKEGHYYTDDKVTSLVVEVLKSAEPAELQNTLC